MNHGRGGGTRGRGRGRASGRTRNTCSPSLNNNNGIHINQDAIQSSNDVQPGGNGYLPRMHGSSSGECLRRTNANQSDSGNNSVSLRKLKLDDNSPQDAFNYSKQPSCWSIPPKFDNVSPLPSDRGENYVNLIEYDYSHLSKPVTKGTTSKEQSECTEGSAEKNSPFGRSEGSPSLSTTAPFDICQDKTGTPYKLKTSLLVQNREKRNEVKRSIEGQTVRELRPGMVLLKRYISCGDQIKLVKTCRQLGLGSGGFYQPAYRDGAKLNLKMMCLGKNWDPETSTYGERRPVDGAEPPPIPSEFRQLVQNVMQETHSSLQNLLKQKNVQGNLPLMSPDICIVNFYTNSGKLGLHQDKDESVESLSNGIPVVSISIGDSAEFLYSDQRDVDKAEKVILESGDVLIFGGKSRLIFHGVSSILPKTAPESLLGEANLRPGRLNLTFRKY